jgi:hypothetical protein
MHRRNYDKDGLYTCICINNSRNDFRRLLLLLHSGSPSSCYCVELHDQKNRKNETDTNAKDKTESRIRLKESPEFVWALT